MAKVAADGFRVIALCYIDYANEQQIPEEIPDVGLTMFGLAAVHDPLRPEVHTNSRREEHVHCAKTIRYTRAKRRKHLCPLIFCIICEKTV